MRTAKPQGFPHVGLRGQNTRVQADTAFSILTISPNDLSKSWGPAIHFLELWNGISYLKPDWRILGVAPCPVQSPPSIPPQFELVRLRVPNVRLLRPLISDLRIALSVIRNRQTSLVYLRVSSWQALTVLALCVLRRPFVVELNGLADADGISAGRTATTRWLLRFLERFTIRRSSAAIAVSDSIADFARLEGQEKVTVVANGVQSAMRVKSGATHTTKPRVLYVGTFTPWDGAGNILALATKFPKVHFVLAGDGIHARELRGQELANVDFLGWVEYERLPHLYSSVDAGIALYEIARHRSVQLSSLKVLEYAASGLPIFASRVKGMEFIEDYGIGVLTRNPNDNECLEDFEQFIRGISGYSIKAQSFASEHRYQLSWKRAASETILFLMRQSSCSAAT